MRAYYLIIIARYHGSWDLRDPAQGRKCPHTHIYRQFTYVHIYIYDYIYIYIHIERYYIYNTYMHIIYIYIYMPWLAKMLGQPLLRTQKHLAVSVAFEASKHKSMLSANAVK